MGAVKKHIENNIIIRSGIYKITCLTTGKFYIGSSSNIKKRWIAHKTGLRHKSQKANKKLQYLFDMYGMDNLAFSVVEVVVDINNLIEREQHYIDLLKPSLNISLNASRSNPPMRSEELKVKLSLIHKGNQYAKGHTRVKSQEEINRFIESRKGWKMSEEQKLSHSKKMKGRKPSSAAIEKMKISQTLRRINEGCKTKTYLTRQENKNFKIYESDVIDIRRRFFGGESYKNIYLSYPNITKRHIRSIVEKKCWKNVVVPN